MCSKCYTTFLVLWHSNLAQKNHILSQLHSGNITENHEQISHFSCLANASEELKLGIIGANIKHPSMSTPIPIFMELSAPLPAHPSNLQYVKFQTPNKKITSVHHTSKVTV